MVKGTGLTYKARVRGGKEKRRGKGGKGRGGLAPPKIKTDFAHVSSDRIATLAISARIKSP